MRTVFLCLIGAAAMALVGCGSEKPADEAARDASRFTESRGRQSMAHGPEIRHAKLGNPLNPAWIEGGKAIYDVRCMPCHRLTEERLVGPGWQGVTKRRTAVWIMNMICNTDKMLTEDAEALKLLERCLVRMPNQNVSVEEARKILEFMRKNDGES